MKVHFVKDNPKPDSAPYREAIVWQKHMSNKKPIQLNKNATKKQKSSLFHLDLFDLDLLFKKKY